MIYNNTSIAVAKYGYISKEKDIDEWELFYDENSYYGVGLRNFYKMCEDILPQNRTTVIFIKDLKLFELLNRNEVIFNFSTGLGKADGLTKFSFFSLKTADECFEFREWNNFWQKVEDCKEFSDRIYCAMSYFDHYKIEKDFVYTIHNEAFKKCIKYCTKNHRSYYLSSLKKWIEEASRNDNFIIDYCEHSWKAGIASYSEEYKDKILEGVVSADRSSCYIGEQIT